MTAHLLRFVANKAVPFNGVVKLSEIHSGRIAACSVEMKAGAFTYGIHTTVLTCKAQLRILFTMLIAKIIRVDVIHARHACQVVDVATTRSVHLEACIVLPEVDDTSLRVVCCPTISDCSWVIDTSAVLRRGLRATLLGTNRLNDDAELGVVSPMFVAEVLREDIDRARRAFQRVPVTAENVIAVASSTAPFNAVVNLSVVRCETVSHCHRKQNARTALRRGLHATIFTCEAQLRVLLRVFIAEIFGKNVVLTCEATQVIVKPATPRVHFKTSSVVPVEDGSNLCVV